MTDLELLKKIKEDPAAFSGIFKLYYKPIFGYVLRRTGDFDDTADVAASTFLKAFIHIKNFSYRGISIKVWLYRIATNEVNQFFRYKKKHEALFERMAPEDHEQFRNFLDQDKEELEMELQKNQQFLSILDALKTLPAKYQEVIALRYFEGKDNKEIADRRANLFFLTLFSCDSSLVYRHKFPEHQKDLFPVWPPPGCAFSGNGVV
ncbi:MAG: RNA polymerase sigma factor [Lewinellaceae bacterium]|nr:RNA polymerase sigma factor [Phaeodactylibacter sp.]MCB9039264.1 RNA polymerase sigma factor [Lewinellaceae bacterium]